MWRGWAGGWDACFCLSLRVRPCVCSSSNESAGKKASRLRNERVANEAGAACGIPEATGEENMTVSNRIVTLESKGRRMSDPQPGVLKRCGPTCPPNTKQLRHLHTRHCLFKHLTFLLLLPGERWTK